MFSLPFRIALATVVLAIHLVTATWVARSQFGLPFNTSPNHAPAYVDPTRDDTAARWNRLIISRWDSGHYVGLALRGYSQCPHRDLRGANLLPVVATCDFRFYPGYPLLGYLASLGGVFPVDFALLAVSLFASFSFLFLWTDRLIVSALGRRVCLLSLLAFCVFPSAFAIVTLQTEPCALALALAVFIALERRHLVLAAFLAGASTGIRASGIGVAAAFDLALLFLVVRERQRTARALVTPLACVALSGWGLAAIMAIHFAIFRDPLMIVHSYTQVLGVPSAATLFPPNPALIMRSINLPVHEGAWLLFALVWLSLGYRTAMRRFSPSGRLYFGALTAAVIGLSLYGSANVAFVSMNRYLLVAIPVFFAVGSVVRRRPVALVLWIAACLFHYRYADLCIFVGGPGDSTLRACHAPQWVGRF